MEPTEPRRLKRERPAHLQCPLCLATVEGALRAHILEQHGEEALRRAVLADKERGMSDVAVGERYGISFGTLQQYITEAYGANVSALKRPKRVKRWQPPNFQEETTTVWSFPNRGDWATHDARYRGNWSPYIPRNVILKYSQPGETVLDYFVGGGTTAVEAKLLGRRCIARDINPNAVSLTLENLRFSPPRELFDQPMATYEPDVCVGDARDLHDIPDGSIDLICAHPPYAGIIAYSPRLPGDLSGLSVPNFLAGMRQVAAESLRVLKPGGKCAILIGDARKSKRVVPIGFQTIRVFLGAGFLLRELVIKRQHHCKTTGFWYTRSIQHNFLLLAHEYLPIFEKRGAGESPEPHAGREVPLPYRVTFDHAGWVEGEAQETTTVWLFPKETLEQELKRNLWRRFASSEGTVAEVQFDGSGGFPTPHQRLSLIFVRWPPREVAEEGFQGYRLAVRELVEHAARLLSPGGFLVLEAMDFRGGGRLWPAGLMLQEDMAAAKNVSLREIAIVTPQEHPPCYVLGADLQIIHRYLLVYARK